MNLRLLVRIIRIYEYLILKIYSILKFLNFRVLGKKLRFVRISHSVRLDQKSGMQERGCRGCESWLDSGVAVCDSGNIMRACNSLVPPQVFLDASAAELRQLLNRDFMPDHVPKSSPLPKLLIKRNFNSPIFIYRPPIDLKRFKIARSKMINRKTHSSGIRSSCNDAIHSDSVAFTLRSFFSSPPPPPSSTVF